VATSVDCAYTISGSGPPLFMVHGIGARRSTWDGLAGYLRNDFTCIAYDLRGHGESPSSGLPFGLDELVADLEVLRSKLGIEKAAVIGHSLGGMIGPAYARAYPNRVTALGLLSTAAFRTADDSSKVKGVVKAMEDTGVEAMLDTLVNRWFTDEFQARHPEKVANRKRQIIETPLEVFLNVFHIYAETEMSPWLREIETPSLVMTGEVDGGCSPRLNEQIARALKNAELVVLTGLKHNILIEAPERVAPPVSRFLKTHSSTGA
jgi:3-oxoadipate enol-lactonase